MNSSAFVSNSRLAMRLRGVFYGWWMVGLTAFMLALMSVAVFQSLGTFLVALERQFGWSRTAMSGAFSLGRVEGAIIGPIEGYLIDRLGSRRMMFIGYVIMGIGFFLFSQVNSLWQFYLAFLVITVGVGLGGYLAMVTVVNNWFQRRRSMAMAVSQTGVLIAGFLVPVVALGIESHGFRWTTLGIGVFLLAVVGPAARAVRNRPEDYGMHRDGDPPHPAPSGETTDSLVEDEAEFTVAQALRTQAFWTITVVHMSSTISIVALSLHLVPKLTDMGMSLSGAGILVLTYTAVALPAMLIAGYWADRLPMPQVTFACLTLQALGIMVIALAETVSMAYLFAVLFGIGFGGRIPLLTAIRGEYFGRKAFATLMGLSMFPNNLGMIAAPLFAGYMYDTTGSYIVPFTVFAILNFLGAFLMLFVRKPRPAQVPAVEPPQLGLVRNRRASRPPDKLRPPGGVPATLHWGIDR